MTSEWSPHVEAAAQAMYGRLNVLKNKPSWNDLDLDATDHYCIAAKLAVDAFHASAVENIDVDYAVEDCKIDDTNADYYPIPIRRRAEDEMIVELQLKLHLLEGRVDALEGTSKFR